MTKKEKIYQNNVGHSVDLFKFGIQKAMDEWAEYAASMAWREGIKHTYEAMWNVMTFDEWWSNFKNENK